MLLPVRFDIFTVKSNFSCFILASISTAVPNIKTHGQKHTELVVDDRAPSSLGVSVVCSVLSVDVISCEFVFPSFRISMIVICSLLH
jgi:hypothetical protein